LKIVLLYPRSHCCKIIAAIFYPQLIGFILNIMQEKIPKERSENACEGKIIIDILSLASKMPKLPPRQIPLSNPSRC